MATAAGLVGDHGCCLGKGDTPQWWQRWRRLLARREITQQLCRCLRDGKTARSKAASVAGEVFCTPLILRTY